MDMLRKGLGGIALLVGLAVLLNYYFFLANEAVGQVIWNILDPLVVIVLGVATLLNVADSLRIRGVSGGHLGQLPRDVVTALAAATTLFYLHNYLLQLIVGVDAAEQWIWHFIVPAAVILLAIEGISLWRSGSRGTG